MIFTELSLTNVSVMLLGDETPSVIKFATALDSPSTMTCSAITLYMYNVFSCRFVKNTLGVVELIEN